MTNKLKYTTNRTYKDVYVEEEPAPKRAILLKKQKNIFQKIKDFFKKD